MVADDTVGSGEGPEGETEMDQKVPACEDAEADGDAEMAASPAEDPPEDARKWKWSVIFLCFYGYMVSVKPGEPFITPYLLSSEKNFTREQVSDYVRLISLY